MSKRLAHRYTLVNSDTRIVINSGLLNNIKMQTIEQIYRERLGILVEEYGTQANLAKKLGISPAQLSQWITGAKDSKTGKERALHRDTARSIEKKTDKPNGWMDQPVNKPSNKVKQPFAPYIVENTAPVAPPERRFPEISWVKAGDFCESPDNLHPGDAERWWSGPDNCSKNTFVLRVSGPSMAPEFLDGDMIFVDPEMVPKHNSDVVVRTPDGTTTFKRLQITPDGNYLMAVNPDFPGRIIKVPEGTVICGVVACLTRMKS